VTAQLLKKPKEEMEPHEETIIPEETNGEDLKGKTHGEAQ
jgi:hypothetical protein